MADREISTETVAAAERLAAVEFTPAERAQMLGKLDEHVGRARARRAFEPANGLGPAVVFDPRLPGVALAPNDGGFHPSEPAPTPLPARDVDIAFAPVSQLGAWLRRGDITSTRLTGIYLERLKRIGATLECTVTSTRELAMAQAAKANAEITAGRYRGPLHGVPWGAKDLLDTDGIATTWGATPYKDRVATRDAAVVARLTEAGAVLIAKLTLGALAFGDTWFGGKTRNPWNTAEGASGSSAGSAAAVAAGLAGFAIGTETLGSIVGPSERCGTTGLRPTFGRVSRAGAMALCWSLDKIGPICRSVEDTALVLDAINGHDAEDPGSIAMPFAFDAGRAAKGLRLGYSPAWFDGEEATALDRAALDAARRAGLETVALALPDLPYGTLETILDVEAAAAFEHLTLSNRDDELRLQGEAAWPNTFRAARLVSAVDFVQAERLRRAVMAVAGGLFAEVDAVIGSFANGSMLVITNFTGHPSLTLRAGFVEHWSRGMTPKSDDADMRPDVGGRTQRVPHGVTLVGRLFDEGTLCTIGMALEAEFGVGGERPPTG